MGQMNDVSNEKNDITISIPWIERFDHRGDKFADDQGVSVDSLTLLQENEFR